MGSTRKAFTILELLIVIAIISILAIIAIPNFIGRIEESKESVYRAEINSVEKAVNMFYMDNGYYPTLQNVQPIYGRPCNIKFNDLVPKYLDKLPHFSYWWVDYKGKVYHTQYGLGEKDGDSIINLNPKYTYYIDGVKYTGTSINLKNEDGTSKVVTIYDERGTRLPDITLEFTGSLKDPNDPTYGCDDDNGNDNKNDNPNTPPYEAMNVEWQSGGLSYENNGIKYYHGSQATVFKSTGKWYWEITIDKDFRDGSMGIAPKGWVLDKWFLVGHREDEYALTIWGAKINNYNKHTVTRALVAGDVLGFALDLDNHTFGVYLNGEYIGTLFTNIPNKEWAPTFSIYERGKITANFGETPFVYDIPEGFLPYNEV